MLPSIRTLIEREALGKQIESILPSPTKDSNKSGAPTSQSPHRQTTVSGPFLIDQGGCTAQLSVEATRAETTRVKQRMDEIVAHAESLRQQIEEGRAAMAARKAGLAKRRE